MAKHNNIIVMSYKAINYTYCFTVQYNRLPFRGGSASISIVAEGGVNLSYLEE